MAHGEREVAWWRISYFIFAVGLSLILSVAFGDRLPNDPDTLGMIASIFAILSGVLIAVISILGDPSMLMDQSWRNSYVRANEVQRKLHRNTNVFVVYIILLAVLFSYMLSRPNDEWYWLAQRLAFFLTSVSFFVSLALPYSLIAIQRQRLAAAIEAMKKTHGS